MTSLCVAGPSVGRTRIVTTDGAADALCHCQKPSRRRVSARQSEPTAIPRALVVLCFVGFVNAEFVEFMFHGDLRQGH